VEFIEPWLPAKSLSFSSSLTSKKKKRRIGREKERERIAYSLSPVFELIL